MISIQSGWPSPSEVRAKCGKGCSDGGPVGPEPGDLRSAQRRGRETLAERALVTK